MIISLRLPRPFPSSPYRSLGLACLFGLVFLYLLRKWRPLPGSFRRHSGSLELTRLRRKTSFIEISSASEGPPEIEAGITEPEPTRTSAARSMRRTPPVRGNLTRETQPPLPAA
jgi:hypothetical protein